MSRARIAKLNNYAMAKLEMDLRKNRPKVTPSERAAMRLLRGAMTRFLPRWQKARRT